MKKITNIIAISSAIGISVVLLIGLGLLISQISQNKRGESNPELEPKPSSCVSYTKLTQELIDKECVDDVANVYLTECVIRLLDRAAAEREWKQRKLEGIKHPQVNKYDLVPDLSEEQLKIRKWRESFEKMRDTWCDAEHTFISGSGTPYGIAFCGLEFELQAIKDLDKLYYETILEDVYDSKGIPSFEPTDADINKLIKVNATSRGCIWAGETDCD